MHSNDGYEQMWSGAAFPALCERHGLADAFESDEWRSRIIGQNYDVSVIPDCINI